MRVRINDGTTRKFVCFDVILTLLICFQMQKVEIFNRYFIELVFYFELILHALYTSRCMNVQVSHSSSLSRCLLKKSPFRGSFNSEL